MDSPGRRRDGRGSIGSSAEPCSGPLLRRRDVRGSVSRWRQRTGEDGEIDEAEAGAAVRFVDGEAEPTEFGHGGPQLIVEGFGRLHDVAYGRHRGAFFEETPPVLEWGRYGAAHPMWADRRQRTIGSRRETMVSNVTAVRRPTPIPAPQKYLLGAGLLIASGLAWAGSLNLTGQMSTGAISFVAIWTLMMAAMMLPSALPTVSLFATVAKSRRQLGFPAAPSAAFVFGYLAAWALLGVAVSLASFLGTPDHPCGCISVNTLEIALPRTLPLASQFLHESLARWHRRRRIHGRPPRHVLRGLLLEPDVGAIGARIDEPGMDGIDRPHHLCREGDTGGTTGGSAYRAGVDDHRRCNRVRISAVPPGCRRYVK